MDAIDGDRAIWSRDGEGGNVGEDQTAALGGEIVVFDDAGGPRVEVIVGEDTVWLSQQQMAGLFGRERSVITRHVANVFAEGELAEEGSVQILHTTPEGGRPAAYYNLDVIISVGYRVKSPRGTAFRKWATGVLRQHLIEGYTLNEKRLAARGAEATKAVELAINTLRSNALVSGDGAEVLAVVQHYFASWQMLRAYDDGTLPASPAGSTPMAALTIEQARDAIRVLRDDMLSRGENPGLFGSERGDALESILGQIELVFVDQPAYPTVEERAAHLLYFTIKNHPLSDGNKRVATLLFLDYLRLNGALLGPTGRLRFSDTALVALALLIAESDPKSKDLVILMVTNLLAVDAG